MIQSGWWVDINDVGNGRWLWNRQHAARAVKNQEPYHANNDGYEDLAQVYLNGAYNNLSAGFSGAEAMRALNDVVKKLNQWIDFMGRTGAMEGLQSPLFPLAGQDC